MKPALVTILVLVFQFSQSNGSEGIYPAGVSPTSAPGGWTPPPQQAAGGWAPPPKHPAVGWTEPPQYPSVETTLPPKVAGGWAPPPPNPTNNWNQPPQKIGEEWTPPPPKPIANWHQPPVAPTADYNEPPQEQTHNLNPPPQTPQKESIWNKPTKINAEPPVPPTNPTTSWTTPPPKSSHGNAPAPIQENFGPVNPVTPPVDESESSIEAAGQPFPKPFEEPKVGANIFTKVVPPVAPPLIFVSTQPGTAHQQFTSQYDIRKTIGQPSSPIIVDQPVGWDTPVIPKVPIHSGSSRLSHQSSTTFTQHITGGFPHQPQENQFNSFYLPQPPVRPNPPPSRFSFATCAPPQNVINFSWDSTAYRDRAVETFYTPLSHRETFKSFHNAISGVNLRQNTAGEDVCLTTAFNWNDFSAVITTFGQNKENYRCSFFEGRHKFALECIPVQQGESFRVYFTKSDDRTYLVAYHCWESGHVEWFTFANIKVLPEFVKREILNYVQTIGFNSNDYTETDYTRCFPDPTNFGHTDDNKVCNVSPHLVQDKNWIRTRSSNDELLFIPMGHVDAYKNLNKIVNGENIWSTQNWNNFCIQSKSGWDSRRGTLTAFNGVTGFGCSDVPNYFRNNRNSWVASCGTNSNDELFTIFVTKTDNRTYQVSKQCWKNGQTTWTVYSTQPTLPPYIRQQILEHVTSLGFQARDTQEINYANCRSADGKPIIAAQPAPIHPSAVHPAPVHPSAVHPAPVHPSAVHPTPVHPSEGEEDVLAAGSLPTGSPFPKCTPPPSKFIHEFYYDSPLYQLRRKEEFYIPLAGKGAFVSINKFIRGNTVSSIEISRNGFCSKYELDYRNFDSRFLESTDKFGRMERLNCKLLKDEYSNKNLHAMDCFRENGEPVFRNYVTMSDYKNFMVTKHCWSSGESTWIIYSAQPEISGELKQQILTHVQELGFNPRLNNEINYKSCAGEGHVHHEQSIESEFELETDAIGSSTALFPRCSPPSSFLRRYTWESSSNNEGIEFFDVAMAHPKSAEIYLQSLGQNINTNHYLSQDSKCLRSRINHDTNVSLHIGHGDAISNDFKCNYAVNQEWILECVSKSSPWLSYRNYGIKSDNLSWILTYQCLNTGVGSGWTVWVAPGTTLSQNTINGILRTVESLGFNGNDYVKFGAERCSYRSRLYKQRTCDCCTDANARYF